jgi:predicted HTH domain antitoxin
MIIEIEVPEEISGIPQYSREDLLVDIAVALFQRKLYSLAKAARFAGLNRIEFQHILKERQVAIPYDLDIDLNSLSHL